MVFKHPMDRARGVLRAVYTRIFDFKYFIFKRFKLVCASFVLLALNVGDLSVSIGYLEWQSLIGDGDICTAFVVCTGPQRQIGGGERERVIHSLPNPEV